jgi:hypothetical protein
MSKTMQILIPSVGDSSTRTQSKSVTIQNLQSIDSISVNTGSVAYTKTGNVVNITCSNGVSVRQTQDTPTKTASSSQQSSANSFPATVFYNDGVYSGNIPKSGLSFVVSGSYTPADSKTQTATQSCTIFQDWTWTGTSWVKTGGQYNNAASSMSYNSGGYSGTLSLGSVTGGTPPAPVGHSTGLDTTTTTASGTGNYSGTVTKPASDTRIWQQNYSGTVSGATTTTDYYAYVVNLTYTDTVRIGTVHYQTTSGMITLPVYDLTMTLPILRIKLPSSIGCFELVSAGDTRSSGVHVMTQYGLKAIAKI